MHYGAPRQRSVVSTLGMLVLGVVACAAWAWCAAPETVTSIAGRLTGSDYVLLVIFLVLGLVAAALFGSLAQAFLQFLMVVMQIGLLVVVIAAGVILWRNYSSGGGAVASVPVLAPAPYPVKSGNQSSDARSDEDRRNQLEAELLKLDTKIGNLWWETK